MTARIGILVAALLLSFSFQVFAQWNPEEYVNSRVREFEHFRAVWNNAAEQYGAENALDYIQVHAGSDFSVPNEYQEAIPKIMASVRGIDPYQTLSDIEVNDLFTGAFLYTQVMSLSGPNNDGDVFLCFWPCCPRLK